MDKSPELTVTIETIYRYDKPSVINTCCDESFVDHVSWRKHCEQRHPSLRRVYICSKCGVKSVSINSVSIHFSKCKGVADSAVHLPFPCTWCDKSFDTKIGLGVHSRSVHPTEFEETKSVHRTKAQWTEEEIRMLAATEVNLPAGTRFVNQALLKEFPERGLEAIKGMRNKNARYKNVIASIREHRATASERILPATPSRDIPQDSTTPMRVRTRELPTTPSTPIRTPQATGPRPSLSLDDLLASESEGDDEVAEDPFVTAIKSTYKCDPKLKCLIDRSFEGDHDSEGLNDYFSELHDIQPKRREPSDTSKYRRKKKVKRYARYQQMFKRSKKDLADMIINDSEEASVFPSVESIKETYQDLYESVSPPDNEPFVRKPRVSKKTYTPIERKELVVHLKNMRASAPGPDNVSLSYLRSLEVDYLLTILNYQLWLRRQIQTLKRNRTILIPKTISELEMATNWRPITLSSLFVRLLHGVLSKRVSGAIHLNPRQKAFVPVDGCAQNTLLLDTLIADARRKHKQLSIVGIDLSKAFDMVSINSIRRAMLRHNLDEELIEYIIEAYTGSTTDICCGPNKVTGVNLWRGVKQGDPLSPVLFNMIMDEFIDNLPPEIGAIFEGQLINCMAFADDIILISETKVGMDKLLRVAEDFFTKRSLRVNAGKCFSLRLSTTKRDRAPYVYKEPSFKIDQKPVEAVGYESFFKYLGIKFNPHGKLSPNIKVLEEMLDRLKRAPLKPFQKIDLLRGNIIPRVLHTLVLGRITKGLLERYDGTVRKFVRGILGLSDDIPLAFFYARIKEGGLGIPKFKLAVPRSLLKRVEKLKEDPDTIMCKLYEHEQMEKLRQKCLIIMETTTIEESINEDMRTRERDELYSKIDGKPLTEFKGNPLGQQWVSGKTSIVNGKNYRYMVQLRIGRLPTLENCNRGREVDKKCRKCGRVNESLQHVVQNCHATHFERMQRHDSIATLIKTECEKKKMTVLWEPHFVLPDRKVKPDLVIVAQDEIVVVDVSIVTEHMQFQHLPETSSLAGAWDFKKTHYQDPHLTKQLMERLGKQTVWYGAIIISMRGIWCAKNDETLKRLKLTTSLRDLAVVRSMEGTIKIWKKFMRAT